MPCTQQSGKLRICIRPLSLRRTAALSLHPPPENLIPSLITCKLGTGIGGAGWVPSDRCAGIPSAGPRRYALIQKSNLRGPGNVL
jgi:hypothetical protein